jgi:hypothetical protein
MNIVLVDVGPRPLMEAGEGLSRALHRLVHAFSCEASVHVCAWHQLEIDHRGVRIAGEVLAADSGRLVLSPPPARVDAMFFYPIASNTPPVLNAAEQLALERLSARAKSVASLSRNDIVAYLLLQAARRGIATNAPGTLGRWGRKDQLEYGLRWYERACGRRIPRPETHPVAAAQAPLVLERFARRGMDAILKPTNSARGEGIRLTNSSAAVAGYEEHEQLVVQELVHSPLLADGFKTDFRVYLLVDSTSRARSRRLEPILVRRAAAPYCRLDERAEITNSSYRRRNGLAPGVQPLEHTTLSQPVRRMIRGGLDTLSQQLLDALFSWKERHEWHGNRAATRIMVWGLDVIASTQPSALSLSLLEVNVYPQLYRADPLCDALVEKSISHAYLTAVRELLETATDRAA